MEDQQVLIRAESAYLVYDQQGSINRVCLVGRGHRPQSYPLGAYVEKLTVIEKSGSAFAHLAKQRERRIIVAGKNIYYVHPGVAFRERLPDYPECHVVGWSLRDGHGLAGPGTVPRSATERLADRPLIGVSGVRSSYGIVPMRLAGH